MIDDFYEPIWAESHDKFAADVRVALGGLARWLRRRTIAKDKTGAAALAGDHRTISRAGRRTTATGKGLEGSDADSVRASQELSS